MQLIESITLAANGRVFFRSIPVNFKHLKILWLGSTPGVSDQQLRIIFNDDQTSNSWGRQFAQTINGVLNVGIAGNNTSGIAGFLAASGGMSAGDIVIPRYSLDGVLKVAHGDCAINGTGRRVGIYAGLWNKTQIIDRVTLQESGGAPAAAGSIFDLYGIG